MRDVIVIGGGITGAGVLRDLALRGFKPLLLEKGAPGRGTTVSSTHLIHGGLRYLLYDRLTTHTTCWDSGHILRTARPLLTRLPILWPVYHGHSHGLATVETLLEAYDAFQPMKGGLPHLRLSPEETLRVAPGLVREGLRGAVAFDEWWVDPVALVEANLESARRAGAETVLNAETTRVLSEEGRVTGVEARIGDRVEFLPASVVVNAAGPWAGEVARRAGVDVPLRLQKGSHLVYDGPVAALGTGRRRMGFLLEAADRSRYVFVVPGPDATLVGPTDIETGEAPDRLATGADEVRYLLDSVRRYFPSFPERYARTSVGARPILGQSGSHKLLSREFEVFDHGPRDGVAGFVTVTGGKMSDYRLMGEETGYAVARLLGRPAPCASHRFELDGRPVTDLPDHRLPWRSLKKFLRGHPRLREAHAMAHLAGGFLRHILRGARRDSAEEFDRRYGQESGDSSQEPGDRGQLPAPSP
jgi:glycerol-3-phosphate dehydrogenase